MTKKLKPPSHYAVWWRYKKEWRYRTHRTLSDAKLDYSTLQYAHGLTDIGIYRVEQTRVK